MPERGSDFVEVEVDLERSTARFRLRTEQLGELFLQLRDRDWFRHLTSDPGRSPPEQAPRPGSEEENFAQVQGSRKLRDVTVRDWFVRNPGRWADVVRIHADLFGTTVEEAAAVYAARRDENGLWDQNPTRIAANRSVNSASQSLGPEWSCQVAKNPFTNRKWWCAYAAGQEPPPVPDFSEDAP